MFKFTSGWHNSTGTKAGSTAELAAWTAHCWEELRVSHLAVWGVQLGLSQSSGRIVQWLRRIDLMASWSILKLTGNRPMQCPSSHLLLPTPNDQTGSSQHQEYPCADHRSGCLRHAEHCNSHRTGEDAQKCGENKTCEQSHDAIDVGSDSPSQVTKVQRTEFVCADGGLQVI